MSEAPDGDAILTAGVDEAGRGCLAGPVVAAAVILDPARKIEGLADSKALSPKARAIVERRIKECAVDWAVATASVEEIERLNILHASLLAMTRAVERLLIRPHRVLIDGNRLPALSMPAEAIVGGDSCVAAISAASILAKEARDRIMMDYHRAYPHYRFDLHKSYATALHLDLLDQHGPSPIHRTSFAPIAQRLGHSADTKLNQS